MIISVDGDDDFGRTDDQSSDGFEVENGRKILYIYTSCIHLLPTRDPPHLYKSFVLEPCW